MAGFKWALNWDTNPLRRGAREASDAIEDTLDVFEDLAREADRSADKAGDALEDGIQDGAKSAVDDLDKLEKKLRDVADEAQTSGRQAGDGVRNVKEGAREASEGMDALKENTASNAKEMGGSFQDVESALDAVQGLAAEAFEGFGPAGVAAGVAVAAGIGLVKASLQGAADSANDLTDEATELATSGETLADRWDEFGAAVQNAANWYDVLLDKKIDRPATNVENLARAIEAGAVSAEKFNEAWNTEDASLRIKRLRDLMKGTSDVLSDLKGKAAESFKGSEYYEVIDAQIEGINGLKDALKDEIKTTEAAAEVEAAMATAKGLTVDEYRNEIAEVERATEAQESYFDAMRDAADPISSYEQLLANKTEAEQRAAQATADATADASDTWEDYAGETKVTMGDLIGDLESQIATNTNFQKNLETLAKRGVGEGLINELKAQGPEVAGKVTEVLANATDSELTDYVQKRSIAIGEAMPSAIGDGLKNKQAKLATDAQSAIGHAMSTIPTPDFKIDMHADIDTMVRQAQLALRNKSVTINVVPRVGQRRAY